MECVLLFAFCVVVLVFAGTTLVRGVTRAVSKVVGCLQPPLDVPENFLDHTF